MNFEHLNIFIAVVENGGFTKAASALHVSHSTASRAVSALEEALGVRLLDRNSRGFKLTAPGRLLYEQGGELLRRAEELKEQLSRASEASEQGLRIAVAPMVCEKLDRALRDFCEKAPNGAPVIYRRGLSEVKSLVEGGRADIGVSFSYAMGDHTALELVRLETSRFCAVAGRGHTLGRDHPLTVEELRSENYITAGGQRSAFTRAVEEPVLEGRPEGEIHTAATLESLFMMVRGGKGITLAPEPMARQFGEGCELLELSFDSEFEIVVFWREDEAGPETELFVRTALDSQ